MRNASRSSDEYNPTPAHGLPAFVGGAPTGYMCVACGYITKELDPIFEDLCLVCLKDWALKQGVNRLIPTADAIKLNQPLEPTHRIERPRSERTTEIMNLKDAETTLLPDGSVKIDRHIQKALDDLKD